jgi:hypothetical protein
VIVKNLLIINCYNPELGQCVAIVDIIYPWYRADLIGVSVIRDKNGNWTFLESQEAILNRNMFPAVNRFLTLKGLPSMPDYLKKYYGKTTNEK